MEDVNGKMIKKRGPPPFLHKIFEMVEDPNTNELISWGADNKSFIIWDQFKFASTLLPAYFRHNNFSSFIYQLNSYGFRKVDYDRWEYANNWFRAGEKELLCKIERRTTNSLKRKEVNEQPFMDPKRLRFMEAEIGVLKSEITHLGIEIQELRMNQEILEHELRNIKSKEGIETLDLILKAIVKSQEKFGNNEEPKTSDVALLNPNSLENDVLVDHENEGEGELTESQLNFLLEFKDLITKY